MLVRQTLIFALIFFAFQVGYEWLRGTPMALPVFAQLLIISVIAAFIYGFVIWLFKQRKNRGN